MPSKFFARTGVFCWAPNGSTLPGLLVTGKCEAGNNGNDGILNTIDYYSDMDIFGNVNPKPSCSIMSKYRFFEMSWAPNGIVGGGNNNGQVVFFTAQNVLNSARLESLSEKQVHNSNVLSISSSPSGKWFISSGSSSDLLLWDPLNLNTPYSPGQMEPNKIIKCVRWSLFNEVSFASVVSEYVNIWDLRQNGQPCMTLAQDNINTWETFSWSVASENEFYVGSVQGSLRKYDTRYSNNPIFESSRHSNGVFSISPNPQQPNFLLSSGEEVFFWNQNQCYTVETRHNDKASKVQWNPCDPNQFIIELQNYPLQFCSLANFGQTEPEAEHLKISKIAVPTSVSLSYGGKQVTANQDGVEFASLPIDDELFSEVQRYEQNKKDKKGLTDFVMDKALKIKPETEELELKQLVWLMLVAQLEGASRNQMLRYLELLGDPKTTSVVSTSVTTGSTVSSSCSSPIEEPQNVSFIERNIDAWKKFDNNDWNMITNAIQGNHEENIERLCLERKWMLATMYAFANDRNLVPKIFQTYMKASPDSSNTASIVDKLCFEWSRDHMSSEELTAKIGSFVQSFPDEKWKIMLGIFITKVISREFLKECMKAIAKEWIRQGKNLRALIPLIISQDVESFLDANTLFHDIEVVQQVYALKVAAGKSGVGPKFEELTARYVGHLLDNGFTKMASGIMRQFENVRNEKFMEMRHIVYETCGGEQYLNWPRPRNPYENNEFPFNPIVSRGAQAITEPLRPAPIHVAPPVAQPVVTNLAPPASSGWNDPPMLATGVKPTINRLGARYPQNLGYNNNNNVYNQNQYYGGGYNRY